MNGIQEKIRGYGSSSKSVPSDDLETLQGRGHSSLRYVHIPALCTEFSDPSSRSLMLPRSSSVTGGLAPFRPYPVIYPTPGIGMTACQLFIGCGIGVADGETPAVSRFITLEMHKGGGQLETQAFNPYSLLVLSSTNIGTLQQCVVTSKKAAFVLRPCTRRGFYDPGS